MVNLLSKLIEINLEQCDIENKRFENEIKNINDNLEYAASNGYDHLFIYFDEIKYNDYHFQNAYYYELKVPYYMQLIKRLLLEYYEKQGLDVTVGDTDMIIGWKSVLNTILENSGKKGLYYDYRINDEIKDNHYNSIKNVINLNEDREKLS